MVLLCFCYAFDASAQQLFTVTGTLFKKNSPVTISFATVTNISRKTPDLLSDYLGGFKIEASLGDTLLFRKSDYTPQILVVLNRGVQTIYLQPIIHLEQVTVKETSKKLELQNTLENYKKKGQYNSLNPSVMSVISSPLSGLYDLFGKSANQARKFQKFTQEELERIEIAKRYNRPLVKKTVEISDEDLETFMLNFQPFYEDIKVWSDYDIITYIKKSYGYFKDNKAQYKIQKLY
ncbi:hypothetical protein [Mucilaginibacter antarcticus]|uniref:Carboxypeptidase-like protein n=1 Tax=Mucilaginibacter antarcticus TaxID=1855725 RepID=A0ABW5XL09_9SPHI